MIVGLSPGPRISNFQREHFTFYEKSENIMRCSKGHMT